MLRKICKTKTFSLDRPVPPLPFPTTKQLGSLRRLSSGSRPLKLWHPTHLSPGLTDCTKEAPMVNGTASPVQTATAGRTNRFENGLVAKGLRPVDSSSDNSKWQQRTLGTYTNEATDQKVRCCFLIQTQGLRDNARHPLQWHCRAPTPSTLVACQPLVAAAVEWPFLNTLLLLLVIPLAATLLCPHTAVVCCPTAVSPIRCVPTLLSHCCVLSLVASGGSVGEEV